MNVFCVLPKWAAIGRDFVKNIHLLSGPFKGLSWPNNFQNYNFCQKISQTALPQYQNLSPAHGLLKYLCTLAKLTTTLLFFSLIFLSACSEYQKVLREDDIPDKFAMAEKLYGKAEYQKALPLLEELQTYYRGTAQGEKVSYLYANTLFQLKNYGTAALYYKLFAETYPSSIYTEEAYYDYALSLYNQSPASNLDQTSSARAISAFQLFIARYPMSDKIEGANLKIDELRGKIEEKVIANALLFYQLADYRAAVTALSAAIRQYPSNYRREELEFLTFKSSFLLAENSVSTKQKERYTAAYRYYSDFIDRYPASQYLNEAKRISNIILTHINPKEFENEQL